MAVMIFFLTSIHVAVQYAFQCIDIMSLHKMKEFAHKSAKCQKILKMKTQDSFFVFRKKKFNFFQIRKLQARVITVVVFLCYVMCSLYTLKNLCKNSVGYNNLHCACLVRGVCEGFYYLTNMRLVIEIVRFVFVYKDR